MLKKFSFLLMVLLSVSATAQNPINGSYWASTGKGHCNLTLNSDSTYEQFISDCTYAFSTKGRYTTKGDTLILLPEKIFNHVPNGKKKLVTDRNSHIAIIAGKFNHYLIQNTGLDQLENFNGRFHATWNLVKNESKKRKRKAL